MQLLNNMGIIASFLVLFAISFYVFSILRGDTRPSKSTWWILALVSLLTLATSYSLGATENLWVQVAYLVGYTIIGILSLFPKYGFGSKLLVVDVVCITGALLLSIIWFLSKSAFIAFLGSIIIDFVGLVPTIKKVWKESSSEDTKAWIIGTTAAFVNILGISSWFSLSHKDWIYALYLFVTNLFVTFLVIKNRKKTL